MAQASSRNEPDTLLPVTHHASEQFVGGHDGLSWRGALADGLIDFGVH